MTWWDEVDEKVCARLMCVVDLQNSASGADMARSFAWVVTERAKADLKLMLGSCTDNTNSMSGRWGGAMALLRGSITWPAGIPKELSPRLPCSLHALHLSVVRARPYLYFGDMPKKLDRTTRHLWNFFWALAKLFNKDHSSYYYYKQLLAK